MKSLLWIVFIFISPYCDSGVVIDAEPSGTNSLEKNQIKDDILCIDDSVCLVGQTCCLGLDGTYGCCPLANAFCCDDFVHCCPLGTICDSEYYRCLRKNETDVTGAMPMSKVIRQAKTMEVSETSKTEKVQANCLDGSTCFEDQTCCRNLNGAFDCCPMVNATCCSDHLHCCPSGYNCDVQNARCALKEDNILPTDDQSVFTINPIPLINDKLVNEEMNLIQIRNTSDGVGVKCDAAKWCQEDQTCCLTVGGHFGCCPTEKAICCDDQEHCCPFGYKCDLTDSRCILSTESLVNETELSKQLEINKRRFTFFMKENPEKSKCEDGNICDAGETCCQTSIWGYGCCLMENAVCCKDSRFCCPQGSTCDLLNHICYSNQNKTESLPISNLVDRKIMMGGNETKLSKNKCGDGTKCDKDQTCCHRTTTIFLCCPMADAVCCSDMRNCCPTGYRCDVAHHKCVHINPPPPPSVTPTPLPSTYNSKVSEGVICPDRNKCLNVSTCCQMPSGEYGCCPYQSAVCCSDREHCCPENYMCDISNNRCRSVGNLILLFK